MSSIYSIKKDIPKLYPFFFCSGTVMYSQWLELLPSRTNFHVSKDVRAAKFDCVFIFQRGELTDNANDGAFIDTIRTMDDSIHGTQEESIDESVDIVDNTVKQ